MGLQNDLYPNSKAGKKHLEELDPLGLSGLDGGGGRTRANGQNCEQNTVAQPQEENKTQSTIPKPMPGGNGADSNSKDKQEESFIHGFPIRINREKQSKHIPGSPYYVLGKSIFLGTAQDAEQLIKQFGGKGEWIDPNRERVDFGKAIGVYVNYETGQEVITTKGIIHYSKNGAHIVPANPNGSF